MVPDSIIPLLSQDFLDKKKLNKALNILKRPQNILKKNLILKLSNGKKKVFPSLRIQHNDTHGPFFGGIIYSNNIDEPYVKNLAFDESIKSSVANIPFGGSFGAVDIGRNKFILRDYERLVKSYAQFLSGHIGMWKDVVTSLCSCGNVNQVWMMEAYEKKKKFHSPATFTSNVYNFDGGVCILEEYLKKLVFNSRFRKLDVAICGFGDRAYTFATNLNQQNFRIVALSDSSGGVVNSSGFDIYEIKQLKNKFTSIKEVSVMTNREFVDNNKLVELPVDILIIATNKINCSNSNAKLILELVSGGVCENVKNIDVLPSQLLNVGITVVNYFDWIQKTHGYRWDKGEISKKLIESMNRVFIEVSNVVDEKKISFKEATFYVGSKRIIESMFQRGRV